LIPRYLWEFFLAEFFDFFGVVFRGGLGGWMEGVPGLGTYAANIEL